MDSTEIDGITFWVGQKWREADRRFVRIVEVAGWDPLAKKVQIKHANRYTWARANRFNRRSNGYYLVES